MFGTICIYIADACIIDYILLFSSSNAKSYRMECTIILALGKLNNCCCTKVFVAYYYTRSTYGDDVSCFPQGDNNCSKIARQRRFRMDIFSLMKRVLEKQRQYHQLQLQQKLYNQEQHMHLQLLVYHVVIPTIVRTLFAGIGTRYTLFVRGIAEDIPILFDNSIPCRLMNCLALFCQIRRKA